jgi:hypothetical protein
LRSTGRWPAGIVRRSENSAIAVAAGALAGAENATWSATARNRGFEQALGYFAAIRAEGHQFMVAAFVRCPAFSNASTPSHTASQYSLWSAGS